jgi:hypothetical protein
VPFSPQKDLAATARCRGDNLGDVNPKNLSQRLVDRLEGAVDFLPSP